MTSRTKARMSFLVDSSLCTRSGERRTPTASTRDGSRLVSAGRADDQIVDRVLWRLLEGHADDEPAVAQLHGPVADEEMGEVLDRDLALEGDAAAARGVRAHPARGFGCAWLVSCFLQPGAEQGVVRIEAPPVGSPFPARHRETGLTELPQRSRGRGRATPSSAATIRPDMGSGLAAKPLKAL